MTCEIVVDIGINHCGNMNLAKVLIEAAKDCGADVAKFQLYNPEELLDPSKFSSSDWEIILKTKLSKEQAKELKDHCDKIGIEFMASAFDFERLSWLEEMNVKRHKIASRSIYDINYVDAVQKTGKQCLTSMGYYDQSKDANEGFQTWTRLKYNNSRLLYCVSEYPTPLNKVYFYKYMFNDYYGFSDHTIGITAAQVAISLGARVIEKHFTLHRSLPGPDQICSLIPSELKRLCQFRNEVTEMRL